MRASTWIVVLFLLATTIYATPAATIHSVPVPTAQASAPSMQSPTGLGGVFINGVAYFLPTSATSKSLTIFDPKASSFGILPVPTSLGFPDLAVASLATAGNFLVLSAGGTNKVAAYDLSKQQWAPQKALEHSDTHTCSVGCGDAFFTFTGDFKKSEEAYLRNGRRLKPADRQGES